MKHQVSKASKYFKDFVRAMPLKLAAQFHRKSGFELPFRIFQISCGYEVGGQYSNAHTCAVPRCKVCSVLRDNFLLNHVQPTEMSEGVAALTDDMIFSCVLMVGRYSA